MRVAIASTLLLLLTCGPPPAQRPPSTGDHGWFCPTVRYSVCYHMQPDCIAAYPGDICVLTKPVYCEDDTTCFATRDDCENWSLCYAR